jgi:hypothetical protein
MLLVNAKNGAQLFYTNDTERMRITSGGNILINQTSALAGVPVSVEMSGNGSSTPTLQASYNVYANHGAANTTWRGYYVFHKSRGTTAGSVTAVAADDYLGTIRWNGTDGTGEIIAAEINAMVDGTIGTNDMPARLTFSTTADGGSSPTERMRIASTGNVCIGGTLPLSNAALTLFPVNGTTYAQLSIKANNTAGSNASIYLEAPGVVGGGMYQNRDTSTLRVWQASDSQGVSLANSATSWGSYSDERMKDIIEPITNALTKVNTLRTVIGKYKTDEADKRRVFLIAQDVQAVLPEAVYDDKSEDKMLSLQYTDIIPLLTAALQEANAKITALEEKLERNNIN